MNPQKMPINFPYIENRMYMRLFIHDAIIKFQPNKRMSFSIKIYSNNPGQFRQSKKVIILLSSEVNIDEKICKRIYMGNSRAKRGTVHDDLIFTRNIA